jgi:hypothetical protein
MAKAGLALGLMRSLLLALPWLASEPQRVTMVRLRAPQGQRMVDSLEGDKRVIMCVYEI